MKNKLPLASRISLLILVGLFSCKSLYDKDENLIWLNYLGAKKISAVKLTGAFNAERYNTIDTVLVTDAKIIDKLSVYSLNRVSVARNSVNLKALRYSCNIMLGRDKKWHKIYLCYTLDGKGLIDIGDNDSIFQANRFIFYADSIFHESYKSDSAKYNQ